MKLSHDRFLQVIASLNADGIGLEQRGQPRVGLRAAVIVAPLEDDAGRMGGTYTVRLQDLSSAGVSFQHISAPRKGSQFVLDVPDVAATATDDPSAPAPTVRILCRVVHAHPAGGHKFVVGAQFVRLWTAPSPALDAARAAAAA